MDEYAKGNDTFNTYFKSQIGWFVVFCVFTFFSVVMMVTR